MAQTTAPILIAGGLSMFDKSFIKQEKFDWKIPIATGIAVGFFAVAEKAAPKPALWLAYLVVVGELVSTSVVTDFLNWFTGGTPTPAGKGAIANPTYQIPASLLQGSTGGVPNATLLAGVGGPNGLTAKLAGTSK
jgi:hypothetical protein